MVERGELDARHSMPLGATVATATVSEYAVGARPPRPAWRVARRHVFIVRECVAMCRMYRQRTEIHKLASENSFMFHVKDVEQVA